MRSCAFRIAKATRRSREPGVKVADLPAGPLNHHWTKSLIASRDGSKLYVSVGSNSNVAENGMDKEERRAAILEIDLATGQSRVFASGLRNPDGLAWEPQTGALWTVVNERDELGSDLVPDYLTSVKDGAFYGWPYSYFGQHVDTRVKPQRPRAGREGGRAGLCARAITLRRWGWRSRRASSCREHFRERCLHRRARLVEPQAASAATRSSSCRSPTASRPESRSTC